MHRDCRSNTETRHRDQQGGVEVGGPGRRLRRHRGTQGVVDRGRVRTDTAPRAASHHRDVSRFHQRQRGIDLSNTDDGTAVLLPRTGPLRATVPSGDPTTLQRRSRGHHHRHVRSGVARRCHRRGDRFGRRETGTGSSRHERRHRPVLEVPRSRSPTRSPARPIWCSARPKRHRSRSFAVSTTRTSVTVRSKKTLSVARTKTSSLTTPARRTSPDSSEAGATCTFAPTTHVAPNWE